MTQFHIKISFHNLLLLYFITICNKNVAMHHPGLTQGFPLLVLFNFAAAIPDKNIVTLAECQLYHFSPPPPLLNVGKKVLLLYELQSIHLQSVTKMLTPVQCWCYGVSFPIQTIIALF